MTLRALLTGLLTMIVAVALLAPLPVYAAKGKKGKETPAGPIQVERRRTAIAKIPNYAFPFIGTYRFDVTRVYPNTRVWTVTESLIRQQLARQEKKPIPDLTLKFTEKVIPGDGEEKPYQQEIEMVRQLFPGELGKIEFTFLVFKLEKPGKLKMYLSGQELEISVHKEGFPGAMAVNRNTSEPSKTFEFYGLTGTYSVKIRMGSNLPTRVTFRTTWTPDEAPVPPTPTPDPALAEEAADDATATDGAEGAPADGTESTGGEEAPAEDGGTTEDAGEDAPAEDGSEGGTEGGDDSSGSDT